VPYLFRLDKTVEVSLLFHHKTNEDLVFSIIFIFIATCSFFYKWSH